MIVRVLCAALHGVRAIRVSLEVDLHKGSLPAFDIVGLAEGALREAKDRVRTALRNSGYKIPPARVIVNLAPADHKKGGSAYDLPLAAGLLAASGIIPSASLEGIMLAGELSLTGELCPVPGMLPTAILARELGCNALLVPAANAAEAAMVDGISVYPVRTLAEAVGHLINERPVLPATSPPVETAKTLPWHDFGEVKGQEHAKRAIEIAASGGHNLLFVGPPGSGKTMLAQRIPGILPPLSFDEALEVAAIYSVAGLHHDPAHPGLMRRRPFRAPHHTISHMGLVGGGRHPRPGEISLAHRGVLFLDELPEFGKQTLEAMRQPLESGTVVIARVAGVLEYPADFMLVAAMNPCPCGFLTDPRKTCTCSPADIKRYQNKLSGPLLDRFDLHIEVPAVPHEELTARTAGEGSAAMAARIVATRDRQTRRYAGHNTFPDATSRCRTNADLTGSLLETACELDAEGRQFLARAAETLALSARAYTRILRIARTIADMDKENAIRLPHLAEALNCRFLDRRAP